MPKFEERRVDSQIRLEGKLVQVAYEWDKWKMRTSSNMTRHDAIQGLAIRKSLIGLLNETGERRAKLRKDIISEGLTGYQRTMLRDARKAIEGQRGGIMPRSAKMKRQAARRPLIRRV